MAPRESHRKYRPGEIAPFTGVYRVLHLRHRPPHEVILTKGQKFPRCRKCGDAVRFATEQLVDHEQVSSSELPAAAVLLVESEPSVHLTLKQVLELDGYNVTVAPSLNAALDMLRWRDFDAVITEYDLETQAAGLRLVQRLNTVTFPPVLIISTANPTVERLRSMLGTRVNYLVFKPIDLDELKSVLSRDLARRSVQYQLAASV
jgi:CheY-like chemotaxis protein